MKLSKNFINFFQLFRPHQCHICHVAFERASTLKIHLHVHVDEKPYECQYCKKKFREKGNMKTHVKTHEKKKAIEEETGKQNNEVFIQNKRKNESENEVSVSKKTEQTKTITSSIQQPQIQFNDLHMLRLLQMQSAFKLQNQVLSNNYPLFQNFNGGIPQNFYPTPQIINPSLEQTQKQNFFLQSNAPPTYQNFLPHLGMNLYTNLLFRNTMNTQN